MARDVARGGPARRRREADDDEEPRADASSRHRTPPSAPVDRRGRHSRVHPDLDTSAATATSPTIRDGAGASCGEIHVARMSASKVSRPSPPQGDSSTASAPLNSWPAMAPARPSTAGSESGHACRQATRRSRHPSRPRRIEAAFVLQTVSAPPGDVRRALRPGAPARPPARRTMAGKAGGDDGQQQRDDEGREREQGEGRRRAVAGEPHGERLAMTPAGMPSEREGER